MKIKEKKYGVISFCVTWKDEYELRKCSNHIGDEDWMRYLCKSSFCLQFNENIVKAFYQEWSIDQSIPFYTTSTELTP